jgi:diguanylate cyclase (GGDEF)-like protein
MGFMKSVPCEVVYIPLIYQDSVLGVLVLGSAKHYSEDEVQLFDFLADQISMALDNARMHQRIHELSITDGLTSLHNRRYLNTRLDQEWARSQRHGSSIAVLLSDIDNFKSVNDSYGHDRGDEVLRQVAAIFKRNARKEDLVARYGGEEFVVILPNTSMDAARQMAERICADARAEEYPWMEDRGATLSIGVAAFPEAEFNNAEELIQAADQAMYKAKTSGKDKVELYTAEA